MHHSLTSWTVCKLCWHVFVSSYRAEHPVKGHTSVRHARHEDSQCDDIHHDAVEFLQLRLCEAFHLSRRSDHSAPQLQPAC